MLLFLSCGGQSFPYSEWSYCVRALSKELIIACRGLSLCFSLSAPAGVMQGCCLAGGYSDELRVNVFAERLCCEQPWPGRGHSTQAVKGESFFATAAGARSRHCSLFLILFSAAFPATISRAWSLLWLLRVLGSQSAPDVSVAGPGP